MVTSSANIRVFRGTHESTENLVYTLLSLAVAFPVVVKHKKSLFCRDYAFISLSSRTGYTGFHAVERALHSSTSLF